MLSPITSSSLLPSFSVFDRWFATAPHFLLRKKAPIRLVPGTISASIIFTLRHLHRLSVYIKLASTMDIYSSSWFIDSKVSFSFFFLFFFFYLFLTGNDRYQCRIVRCCDKRQIYLRMQRKAFVPKTITSF